MWKCWRDRLRASRRCGGRGERGGSNFIRSGRMMAHGRRERLECSQAWRLICSDAERARAWLTRWFDEPRNHQEGERSRWTVRMNGGHAAGWHAYGRRHHEMRLAFVQGACVSRGRRERSVRYFEGSVPNGRSQLTPKFWRGCSSM